MRADYTLSQRQYKSRIVLKFQWLWRCFGNELIVQKVSQTLLHVLTLGFNTFGGVPPFPYLGTEFHRRDVLET